MCKYGKETCKYGKETCKYAQEMCKYAKETCKYAKEMSTRKRDLYIRNRDVQKKCAKTQKRCVNTQKRCANTQKSCAFSFEEPVKNICYKKELKTWLLFSVSFFEEPHRNRALTSCGCLSPYKYLQKDGKGGLIYSLLWVSSVEEPRTMNRDE